MNTESSISPATSILIVDDDPDICLALKDFLQHEGYGVQTVGSGSEGIAEARQRRYGAVILDIGLPDLDGLLVLKHLLELDATLPVIVLTAFTTQEKTVGTLSQGAFAYLIKPYNRDELRAILHHAVGMKELAVKAARVEHALSESEERFRSIVESASDAIILADRQGLIISWNKAAATLFAYTEEEVLGKPLTVIMPARYRAMHQRGLERLQSTGVPRLIGKPIELHGLRKDGTEFPLELSLGTWQTPTGTFYSGIIRDITERKRAEDTLRESQERFRQLAEHIREVFWLTDPEKNQMIYISPGYEDIWQRTCESLYAAPLSWLDAIHPDDRDRILDAALSKQATGEYDEEYRIVRPDGTVRWIWDRAFPIRDTSGRVYRIAGLAEDITERKQG